MSIFQQRPSPGKLTTGPSVTPAIGFEGPSGPCGLSGEPQSIGCCWALGLWGSDLFAKSQPAAEASTLPPWPAHLKGTKTTWRACNQFDKHVL